MEEVVFAGVNSEGWNGSRTGGNPGFALSSRVRAQALVLTESQLHDLQWWVEIPPPRKG